MYQVDAIYVSIPQTIRISKCNDIRNWMWALILDLFWSDVIPTMLYVLQCDDGGSSDHTYTLQLPDFAESVRAQLTVISNAVCKTVIWLACVKPTDTGGMPL